MKIILNFFKYHRFLRNKTTLLSICSTFIDLFEKEICEKNYYDSCKDILMKEISKYISADINGVSVLDEKINNFTEISVATISTVSFEFFEYCKFRMGGSYYAYNYCSPMMSRIHFKALQWGFDHGFVTEEEMEEDRLAFRDAGRQIT